MVVIRLARGGMKKRPFYHLVVADKRSRRDGRYIERVGYFNPSARGAEVPLFINVERVEYWRSVGAQTSDRVGRLLHKFAIEDSAVKSAAAHSADDVLPVAEAVGEVVADNSVVDAESAPEEVSVAQESKVADELPKDNKSDAEEGKE